MYTDLKSYQNAVIIHDFTVEFVKRYVDRSDMSNKSYKSYSRMADQMIQAARSGKQNIAEATSSSKQKPKSEPMLLGVASASLKELLEDYQDYLRQHGSTSVRQARDKSLTTSGLKQWEKNDPRALRVRELAYRSDRSNGSTRLTTSRSDTSDRSDRSDTSNRSDTSDRSDRSDTSNRSDTTYKSYQTYMSDPEQACNAMICLINQTAYLLDNQIRAVERQLEEKGVSVESRSQKLSRILAEGRRRERESDALVAEVLKKVKLGQGG